MFLLHAAPHSDLEVKNRELSQELAQTHQELRVKVNIRHVVCATMN